MNNKWQSEIKKLINSSHHELRQLQEAQEARHSEKILKISELKNILRPKLAFVISVMQKDPDLGKDFLENGLPKLNEADNEVEFIMPGLSEVNKMDMYYRIEFEDNNKVVLCAYDKYSADKLELVGKIEDDFETFIEENIKRFLVNWYNRKKGDQLAQERVLQLKITSRSL
jgi:hypothetical protein